MRRRYGLGDHWLIVASALLVGQAHAATILLVTDGDTEVVMKRIRAELEAAGFSVVTSPPSEGVEHRSALLDEARRRSAMAALRVKSDGAGVELWVVDRVTGKTVLRDVPQAEDDAVLATKATELLRASLLEVKTPGFTTSEVPPPKQLESFVPPLVDAPGPVGGIVSGFVSAPFLGKGGMFVLMGLGVHVPVGNHLQPGLRFALSVTRPELSEPEGTSRQSYAYALADLDYHPLGVSSPWSPVLGFSVGGSVLTTSGNAIAPYTSNSDSVVSSLGTVRGGLRLHIYSQVSLQADCSALAMIPTPNIRYSERSVAKVRLPAIEAAFRIHVAAW